MATQTQLAGIAAQLEAVLVDFRVFDHELNADADVRMMKLGYAAGLRWVSLKHRLDDLALLVREARKVKPRKRGAR